MPFLLPHSFRPRAHAQRGLSLIELLVGIIIGLMVVAVAMGGMMTSRTISGTVSNISQIQQQAAYAFRVMGEQIRRVGALHLQADFGLDCVGSGNANRNPLACLQAQSGGFDLETALHGRDTPTGTQYKLSVASRNYQDESLPGGVEAPPRDCLGEKAVNDALVSQFFLDGHELKCTSSSGNTQALLQNVADFGVRYLLADGPTSSRYTSAAAVESANAWDRVLAVQVCLVLFGTERMDVGGMPEENLKYRGCAAPATGVEPEINITSLDGVRKNRRHIRFRTVFQRRSQGVSTSA